MPQFIQIEKKETVVYVTLNRPEVRNAFHPQMIEEITEVFHGISAEKPRPRGIVLKGNGKVFCAGADLNWMQEMVNYNFIENKKDSEKLYNMFAAIRNCPVPVIAAVQGAAMGGALGLIAACDYVIADKDTQFSFSEVKIGLVPAVISSFILSKTVAGIVSPLMMFGDVFRIEKALQCGLVHESVNNINSQSDVSEEASELLRSRVEDRLKSILNAGPEAISETKKLISLLPNLTWAEHRDHTTRIISERRMSSEGQEGLKSFLMKGVPSWRKK